MWDDAQALRKLGNTLITISLLLVLYGAVHYAVHLPVFSLRIVQLESEPQHIDISQVEAVLHKDLQGNFFTVDLAQVRDVLEKLPWVRKATVQRHFPWQLDVKLEEQVPLAIWNTDQLVSLDGEVFTTGKTRIEDFSGQLPSFTGPEGSSIEMVQQYEKFSDELAPLGKKIAMINLSERQAWQLRLQNEMVLELGREQMEQRLARFVAAYPGALEKILPPVKYVDLRYRNGFAARMAG